MVLKTTEAEGTPSMCVAEGVNTSNPVFSDYWDEHKVT